MYLCSPTSKDDIKGYDVWVLNCTEVEIDVLTGEYKVQYIIKIVLL